MYIHVLNEAVGALLTWPDQWGVTSVLPVSGWTSVIAGVLHWVWVAAVGLWAAACLGVAGATDGCTVGAVGACCSCTASEVDGVVTGYPATSTLGCMSGLTASGWCSRMWSCAHLYSAPPMTLMMYEPWSPAHTTVAGSHSVLSLLIIEIDCPAWSGAFLWQPVQSWLVALCTIMFSCCIGVLVPDPLWCSCA